MSDTMTEQPPGGRQWSGLPHPLSELRRSEDDRWIAGVCGGIARSFHVDTWIVRLIAFVLGVTSIGVPLYLLAWLLVPTDASPSVAAAKRWNRNTVIAISALIVIGCLAAFGPDDVAAPWRAAPWILVGLGAYLILRADRDARGRTVPASSGVDPTAPLATSTEAGEPQAPRPIPSPRPLPPRPPRRRSVLTPITLFGLLALCGAAVMAGGHGWARPAVVSSIGLCMVGGALLVSAFVGRARGLRLIGVLIALPLLAAVAAGPRWSDWGDRSYRPAEMSQLRDRYELGVGRSRFDLRDVDLDRSGTTTLSIDQLAGQVVVWLPADTTTELRADVSAGEVTIDDEDQDTDDEIGRHLDRTLVTGDGDARLVLDVDLAAGQLVIHRAAADRFGSPGATPSTTTTPAPSTTTSSVPTSGGTR